MARSAQSIRGRGDVAPQHQQLGILGRLNCASTGKPSQQLAEGQIGQSYGHAPIIWPGRHRGELAAQDLRPSFLAPTGSSRDARGRPLQRVGVSAEPTMGTMPASASERADTLRGIDRSRPRRWRVVVGHGQSSVMRWSSTSSLPSGATSPHFVGELFASSHRGGQRVSVLGPTLKSPGPAEAATTTRVGTRGRRARRS